MKNSLILIFAILWFSVSGTAGQEKLQSTDFIAEKLANGFVTLLAKGEFLKATADFDNNMKAALPPGTLEAIWKSQLTILGEFQKIETTRMENYQQYRIVFVTCRFKKQLFDLKVVIDKSDKIAGLFFVPTQTGQYRTPVYAKPGLFKESDVTIGEGEWALPGTLTLPSGKGPFPAVILVHGSGPQNRDESIGPNKPFRDLAWGLASQGIAVLRYDKRTLKYASKLADMKGLTVKEETIDDAIEAVSLLRKTEDIDTGRIFVLGHSLGGMLAPRIAAGCSNIAGLIILAGAARPLEDLIVEQTLYQASLAGELTADDKAKIEEIKHEVDTVRKLSKESPEDSLLLGVPVSYWLSLKSYNPAAVAKTLKQPMLILQGEKDCQVRMDDFNIWQKTLSSRTDITFKSYQSLNHLFMEVPGQSTGAEYLQINNVSETVIGDIAGWIKKH